MKTFIKFILGIGLIILAAILARQSGTMLAGR